jgi:hypothetical protein
MNLIIFCTGLGTNKEYYQNLLNEINRKIDVTIYFYYFDQHCKDNVNDLYDLIIKFKTTYENILVCAFSIACHASLEACSKTNVKLMLIDPINLKTLTRPIKIILFSPPCILMLWDTLSIRIKTYILSLIGNETPLLVNQNIAAMSMFYIRELLKKYILAYRIKIIQDINPIVLVGKQSPYKYDPMWKVIELEGNHHIIYYQSSKVANEILKHI